MFTDFKNKINQLCENITTINEDELSNLLDNLTECESDISQQITELKNNNVDLSSSCNLNKYICRFNLEQLILHFFSLFI
jgi:hypothetical protein